MCEKDSRFKFVDDLTTLEKINFLLVGMASHNLKNQVPSEVNISNLIIPSEHLNSQEYLNNIQKWTVKQKMKLNEQKTKFMIFNFSKKKQFSTQLTLNGNNIEAVKEIKLLVTIISDDLKWNKNTRFLVKRAYSRMDLLRQLNKFTNSTRDKIHIYKTYVRSVLEQSCVFWSSNLTKRNIKELERVQKVAIKLITNNKKKTYKENMKHLNIETLTERRNILSKRFAETCINNPKTRDMFKERNTKHNMKLQNQNKHNVQKINTVRLQRSAIPQMTHYLNMMKKTNKNHQRTKTN